MRSFILTFAVSALASLFLATQSDADEKVACVQSSLTQLGFDPGSVDGALGPATREAFKAYAESFRGLDQPTSFDASEALVECVDLVLSRVTKHRISVADGISLEAYLHRPLGNGRAFPTVVVLHGWGGSAKETNYTAQLLTASGFAALTVSMRGWGGSDGVDDCGLEQATDTVAILEWLAERSDIDGDRLGLLGYSQGGQVALLAAAQSKIPRFVTAFFPPVNMTSWAEQTTNEGILNYVREFCAPDMDARSPINFADQISAPVLLVHGTRDSRVPVTQSLEMSSALKEANVPVLTKLVPGAPHLFSSATWESLFPDVIDFTRKNLVATKQTQTSNDAYASKVDVSQVAVFLDIPALSIPTDEPSRLSLISPSCSECVDYLAERTSRIGVAAQKEDETILFFAQNDADLEILSHFFCDRSKTAPIVTEYIEQIRRHSHFLESASEVEFVDGLRAMSHEVASSHGVSTERLAECTSDSELHAQLAASTAMIAWAAFTEDDLDQTTGTMRAVNIPGYRGGTGVGPNRNARFLSQLRAIKETLRHILRETERIEAQRERVANAARSSQPRRIASSRSSSRREASAPRIPVQEIIDTAVQAVEVATPHTEKPIHPVSPMRVTANYHAFGPDDGTPDTYVGEFIHRGLDLAASRGDRVVAPVSGEIVFYRTLKNTGEQSWLDTFIVLRGNDGRHYILAHVNCSVCDRSISITDNGVYPIESRRLVSQGDVIGRVAPLSSTNPAVADHLHVGIVDREIVDSSGRLDADFRNGSWAFQSYNSEASRQAALRRSSSLGFVDPSLVFD